MKSISARIVLGLLMACAASASLKQEPQKIPPNAVMVGSPDYTFKGFFTGLALQPFANNLDYGAEAIPFNYSETDAALSPNWVIPQISTDFHFGFDIAVLGIFHNANSSLMVNWERFHSSTDSDSFSVSNVNYMFGPFFEIGPDASPYKTGKGEVSFHFDEVNVDYGTFVDFGSLLHMNLFTGVSFGRIVEHRFTQFSDFPGKTVRTLTVPSKFTGAGPQLGVHFIYDIIKGFQFAGDARAALLVGKFRNSTTFSTLSNFLATSHNSDPNIQKTTVYSKTGIVPAFEGKLGLSYEYVYRCRYPVKIEAGYQAQIYINSIRSVDMGSEVALNAPDTLISSTSGVYARTFERTVSDFGLAGPYVTLDAGF